jgi:hypothetical protein
MDHSDVTLTMKPQQMQGPPNSHNNRDSTSTSNRALAPNATTGSAFSNRNIEDGSLMYGPNGKDFATNTRSCNNINSNFGFGPRGNSFKTNSLDSEPNIISSADTSSSGSSSFVYGPGNTNGSIIQWHLGANPDPRSSVVRYAIAASNPLC